MTFGEVRNVCWKGTGMDDYYGPVLHLCLYERVYCGQWEPRGGHQNKISGCVGRRPERPTAAPFRGKLHFRNWVHFSGI